MIKVVQVIEAFLEEEKILAEEVTPKKVKKSSAGRTPKGWRALVNDAGGKAFITSLSNKKAKEILRKTLEYTRKRLTNDRKSNVKDFAVTPKFIDEWVNYNVSTRGDTEEVSREDYIEYDGTNLPDWVKEYKDQNWVDNFLNTISKLKNVLIAPRKTAKLWFVGYESDHDRLQYGYNEHWVKTASAKKYFRNQSFNNRIGPMEMKMIDTITQKNEGGVYDLERDYNVTLLILSCTGMRAGSKQPSNQKIDRKTSQAAAFGLCNLQHKHVTFVDDKAVFTFPGKGNVMQEIKIDEPALVDEIRRMHVTAIRREKEAAKKLAAAQAKGATPERIEFLKGRVERASCVFTDYDKTRVYFKKNIATRDDFLLKDFRTSEATLRAYEIVNRLPTPKTPNERKRMIQKVAKEVASSLGNTPSVSLVSYINPAVWGAWYVDDMFKESVEELEKDAQHKADLRENSERLKQYNEERVAKGLKPTNTLPDRLRVEIQRDMEINPEKYVKKKAGRKKTKTPEQEKAEELSRQVRQEYRQRIGKGSNGNLTRAESQELNELLRTRLKDAGLPIPEALQPKSAQPAPANDNTNNSNNSVDSDPTDEVIPVKLPKIKAK